VPLLAREIQPAVSQALVLHFHNGLEPAGLSGSKETLAKIHSNKLHELTFFLMKPTDFWQWAYIIIGVSQAETIGAPGLQSWGQQRFA